MQDLNVFFIFLSNINSSGVIIEQ
ncbi:unnamed protein product [Nezara viridula]|uniref:Uncharacterized protein n=1 Tax=Nezara viridula TaxID=85310 RepID=A0A9P0EA02_NEZVI|nr:unnamed protein product [Nezara viridula]